MSSDAISCTKRRPLQNSSLQLHSRPVLASAHCWKMARPLLAPEGEICAQNDSQRRPRPLKQAVVRLYFNNRCKDRPTMIAHARSWQTRANIENACRGRIEQDGTPEEIMREPNSPFVMHFTGDVNQMPSNSEVIISPPPPPPPNTPADVLVPQHF